jgi:multidrug resistance efflux pump
MKLVMLVVIGLSASLGASALVWFSAHAGGTRRADERGTVSGADDIAANGVTEGARPEMVLRSEVTGIIRTLAARENQEVPAGTLLVELENSVQRAEVALARAEIAAATGERDRVRNGEREERRKALDATVRSKNAAYLRAKALHERSRQSGTGTSTEQQEKLHFSAAQAEADWKAAQAEYDLVMAPPRADELAAAEGRLQAAQARLERATAELERTRICAPAAGRILRVYREPGDLVAPTSAQPILLMADASVRRARLYVEEFDALRVREGLPAIITVDGLADREFHGRVVEVLTRMGKRAPEADEPQEFKDMYFREVIVKLTAAAELPLNLRVRGRILMNR